MATLAEQGTAIFHDNLEIAVRIPDGRIFDYCRRCGGSGRFSFNLQDGTVCYGCYGSGLGKETTEADAIRRADNRAKARAKAAEKERQRLAEQEKARAAWADEHPALATELALLRDAEDVRDPLLSLVEQAAWRPLTTAQAALAERLITEREERVAKLDAKRALGHYPAAVGDKITVEVTVTMTRVVESAYNGRPVSKLLLVLTTAEGYVLKTFTQAAWAWEAEKGDRLRVTATVKSHGEYNNLPETMLTRPKAEKL